jgi:hypothetical protein
MRLLIIAAIVTALLLSSSSAIAAGCKYKQKEIDVFTKERMVRTDWDALHGSASRFFGQMIGSLSVLDVAATREGDRRYLDFKVKLSDTTMYTPRDWELRDAIAVPKGASLTIVLADETAIEVYADKTVRGTTKVKYDEGIYVVKSTLTPRYALDDVTIKALVAQEALGVRMTVSNGIFEFTSGGNYIDFGIHKKSKGGIRDAIYCVE